ncbi:MAG TPA: ABC transporter ATP-binding protein [Xanthobacteraceae bacterium]|nr:ABC transporter ATP-binding protein [Xanthobacteraceae bacterium]
MADAPSLALRDLQAFYGDSHVLHGVSLDVSAGEVVTIIGRNGAGKTTTLRSIMGMVERRTGSIMVAGQEVIAAAPEKIARLGVGYVPEERGIYATLDVTENLMLPRRLNHRGMSLEAIYKLFPNLYERRHSQGTRLSGGEQQMLAVARVLRTGASLFLLDEPTEGLAPVIVQQIGAAIELMKSEGHTILLVEQNFRFAKKIADRHYVMERGRIIDMAPRADIERRDAQIQQYLGI